MDSPRPAAGLRHRAGGRACDRAALPLAPAAHGAICARPPPTRRRAVYPWAAVLPAYGVLLLLAASAGACLLKPAGGRRSARGPLLAGLRLHTRPSHAVYSAGRR